MTREYPKLHTEEPQSSPSKAGRNGGNGKEIYSRISAIETHLKYLATKEDIQKVQTAIKDSETNSLRRFVGILVVVILAFVTLVYQFLPSGN